MSSGLIVFFDVLTPVDAHRVPLGIRVCAPSLVSVVDFPEYSFPYPLPIPFVRWFECLSYFYHQVHHGLSDISRCVQRARITCFDGS